jgi:hypothetical protein
MDPCIFPDKTNPITKNSCRETFTNLINLKSPDDNISKLYFASLGLLATYILYKIMLKNGMLPQKF